MSSTRTAGALAVAAMALVAACTSEQSTEPGATLGSAVPTTSSPPTTSATPTTDPGTTDATTPSTAPDTTEATPTTLPSGPAAVNMPVLAGGGTEAGWLNVGAWATDRWARAVDGAGDPAGISIDIGTTLTVSDLGGERNGTAAAPAESCFDERTGPRIDTTIEPPDPPGFGYGSIATLPRAWPLKPRPVAVTTAAVPTYVSLGRAAFDGEPVDATLGRIEQLVVADLDGDGDDEALVAFEYVPTPGPPGSPGDLSSLLIIDTTTRTASTVVRSLVASDTPNENFVIIDRFRVIDVADLNGDGRMEVVVHAWYYEGAAVLVYEYNGSSLVEVLASGCGA